MNRIMMEELVLAAGFIAVTMGALLILQGIAPDIFSSLTGHATIGTSVNVIKAYPSVCDTDLEAGWNLVSFYCVSNGDSLVYALQSIDGVYTKVFQYDPGQAIRWQAYAPDLPSWVIVNLNSVYRTKGYWIYLSAPANYDFVGTKKIQNVVDIYQGWNLIGYPTNNSRAINDSLLSSTANITEIRAYNASIPAYWYYPPTNATDTAGTSLRYFFPYWGYWVYANNSGSWVVNW